MVAVVSLALAGCSSGGSRADTAPPATRSVVRVDGSMPVEIFTEPGVGARHVDARRADVWATLPAVYERLGIPLAEVDAGAGRVGNPAFQTRTVEGQGLGRFVDCGSSVGGPLVNRYRVTLSVQTEVREAEDGGTIITTTVRAHGEPQSVGGSRLPCRSRGTLELRVAQVVVEELGG